MDENFDPDRDSRIKLLYMESIKDPDRLLLHASSLIEKGCRIAAIKQEVPKAAVRCLFAYRSHGQSRFRCQNFRKNRHRAVYPVKELTTGRLCLLRFELKGRNFAIVTIRMVPVMLTDALLQRRIECSRNWEGPGWMS